MISSKYRISKSYFPAILKNPSISGDYFRAVIAPSISKDLPHFAVTIPKKYAKRAVMRNMLRRTVYQVIGDHINQLPIKSVIFTIQKTITIYNTPQGRKNTTLELSKDIKSIIDQIIKKYGKNS